MSKRMPTIPKLIQLIHIAKSQLHLDDGTYRQMLTEITSKDSCSKMTKSELVTVFEHLKTLGFKTTPAKGAGKVALQFISTADAIRVIETLKKWQQRVEDAQTLANIHKK